MCATDTGRVVEVVGDEALVDLAGRIRRLPALLVPDLRPGDHVLIGLGHVLARCDPPRRRPHPAAAPHRRI